jgi:integrase
LSFIVSLKELKRKKPLSTKSIKNAATALSSFFEYCFMRGLIEVNQAKTPMFRQNLARLIKERRKIEQNIQEKARSLEEIKLLIDASYRNDFEFGLFVELLISTGLRLGEASALTWGDLNQSKRDNEFYWTLSVNKTLNPKNNLVQNSAKCGLSGVIPVLNTLVSKWCHKIGIKRTTAHCLRDNFVTLLETSGHSIQQVQKMARHNTLTMTIANYKTIFSTNGPNESNDGKYNIRKLAKSCPRRGFGTRTWD